MLSCRDLGHLNQAGLFVITLMILELEITINRAGLV